MATAIPVHKFCEDNSFFFKRKKEKKFEQSQSIRTDYSLIGIFVIGGWGNLTLVFSTVLTKLLSFQTENVLTIFCQQIVIIFSTRLCNSKHKITFNLVI